MNHVFRRLATVGRALAADRRCVLANIRPVSVPSFAYASSSKQQSAAVHLPYLNHENFNAHCTMMYDPSYSETVVNTNEQRGQWPVVTDQQFHELMALDYSARTASEVCNDFRQMSVYVAAKEYDLLDSKFDGLRDRLIATAADMTDNQLMSVFESISLWNVQNGKDPVFYRLWSVYDKQCIERYKNWSLNKLLLFMDYWYIIKLSKLSNFVWMGVRKLARKPSRLTSKQLVQMMFYANTSRKFLPTLPMYDIETEICQCYNDLNIKELGIVSLGFFKTQTPIRNQALVSNLYKSVIKEIKNIKSLELAAFLKILRYCSNHRNAENMYKLMDVLVEKVDEVQIVCCTHMALLGTNLLIKHEHLLKRISQRMVAEISEARVKDLERITLALTMYNYNPKTNPCIFKTVLKQLKSDTRDIEFEKHTKSYLYTLSYLAVNDIYSYGCISKALDNETLNKCFGKKLSKFTIPRDILFLNNSLLVECPDYSGPLLSDTLRKSCNEHLAWVFPSSSSTTEKKTDRSLNKLYKEMLQLFKNEVLLHPCYILPHLPKCDIIFCIGTDNKLVTIPETMRSTPVFNDFYKPPDLGKWFVIMLLGRNSVTLFSNEYTGLTLCKVRQLKKLGYEPIMLTNYEIENEDVQKLLRTKLKIYDVELN